MIVTPKNGTAPYYDESLLKDVAANAEVIHTGSLEPFAIYNMLQGKRKDSPIPVGMMGMQHKPSAFKRLSTWLRANLFVPDARRGWNHYAYQAALARAKVGDIDAIVTTGPPHSTHLVGLRLKAATGLPWLADLRDPWTNIYYNKTMPRLAKVRAWDLALETEVLKTADAVTVVSGGMAEEFADRRGDVQVVYNGYDESDLPAVHPAKEAGRFTLAHVGNFFPNSDSVGLRAALQRAMKEIESFADVARFRFVGLVDSDVLDKYKAAGLERLLDVQGPKSHAEAVMAMFAADCLVLVLPADSDSKIMVSGKIFEYLTTGNPIVGIGAKESGANTVLKDCERAELMDRDDEGAIFTFIKATFAEWQMGQTQIGFTESVKKYSRRNLAREMTMHLETMCAKKNA